MSGTGTGTADPATGSDPSATSAVDPNVTTPPADPSTDPGTGTDPAAVDPEVAKWKALARKHEQRARDNATAATELAAIKDKDKTELQRAQDRATKAEADAADALSARYRLLAAAGNGLSPDLVDFLGNGTEEEISERAKALSTVITSEADKRLDAELARYGVVRNPNGQTGTAGTAAGAASLANGRRPIESLRPGSVPAGDHTAATDNNALLRQMWERR